MWRCGRPQLFLLGRRKGWLVKPNGVSGERNLPMIRLVSLNVEPTVMCLPMMVWTQNHDVEITEQTSGTLTDGYDVMRLSEANPLSILKRDRMPTERGANLAPISTVLL